MADATDGRAGTRPVVDRHPGGMLALRGYLVVVAIMLLVKAIQLGVGH